MVLASGTDLCGRLGPGATAGVSSRPRPARRPRAGPARRRRRAAGRRVAAAEPAAGRCAHRTWCCSSTGCAASTPGSGSRRTTARCTRAWPPRTRPGWCAATCAAAAPRWPARGSSRGLFTPSPRGRRPGRGQLRYAVRRAAGDRAGQLTGRRPGPACTRWRRRSRARPGRRRRRRTTCWCRRPAARPHPAAAHARATSRRTGCSTCRPR